MANELRVGIVADASGLSAGLSAAESQVTTSAQRMAAAQNVAAAAAKNLADAQLQVGASAKLGNETAKAIIAEYSAANVSAVAAVSALTEAVSVQVPVLREQAAAAETASVATRGLGISSRQAATAGISMMEGRLMGGNRAAAAFLSTTLGLGPVLQAAFPVIGILALAEVLGQVIKGIANFSTKASELATELGTDWLTGAIGQMTGLAKATEQADKQIEQFAKDNDNAKDKIAEAAVEHARLNAELLNPGTKSAQAGTIAADDVRAQQMQKRIDGLQREKELAIQAAAAYGKIAESGHTADRPDVTLTTGERAEQRKLQDQSHAEYLSADLAQTALIAEKENLITQAEVDRAKIEKVKEPNYSDMLAAQQVAHGVSLGETVLYWQHVVAETGKYHEELLRAEEAFQKNLAEPSKIRTALDKVDKRQNKEAAEAAVPLNTAGMEAKPSEAEAVERMSKALENQLKDTEAVYQKDMLLAALHEKMGESDARVEAERLAAIKKQEAAEMALIQAQQKQIAPLGPTGLDEKTLKQWQDLQDKLVATQRKADSQMDSQAQKTAEKLVAEWKRATDEINRDFTRAFDSILTKQDSVGKAFGKMLGTMELQLVGFIAQYLLKKEEQYMLDSLKDAKLAAKNAYAWGSSFGGPVAGAIAAAVAFAAVDAFEAGGIVRGSGGSPVPIIAHAGERVLSAGQTSNFESLVNNGGNRSATLHQENHFGGGVTEQMLASHTAQTMTSLRRMLRPEAFV